jgi:hypothetical protein
VNEVVDILIWPVLVFQAISVAVSWYVYRLKRSKSLGWLCAYFLFELLSECIGLYLAKHNIYNHHFYHYFSLLPQFSIFQFFQQNLKLAKSVRILRYSYVISVLLLIAIDLSPFLIEIKMLFDFISLFTIFASILLLNERIHQHGGLEFREDPESKIAMILAVTICMYLFANTASYSIIYAWLSSEYEAIFIVLIGVSIIIRNGLVSRELWKLR